ncbi:hypothetical protein RAMLITH_18690 [Ramlibacter sp. RBP-2]|uniref:Uncharacterized protein n=1 Tax=Ramlibacter lithotrophicus TaxID=2606681 RepID=A0A7X6I7X0_9BURK|nr:hypothetical protein [Ramlibacter lithotrophicus]NKE67853.1 hypothetical protein [Ramlibacter lithotrophicus]
MELPLWLVIILGIAAAILGLWLVVKIEEFKEDSRRKFKGEMVRAILHTQPSWQQMLDIAETSDVSVTTTYQLARELLKDILTGADKELQSHRALIEGYISTHKRTEPFEGLPNEIRIHLERLRDHLDGKDHFLEPLTIQIRELVTVYKKDYKAQKRYTTWGFFIGVAGAVFAAYAYFYPASTTPPPSVPNAHVAPR